jgi:hypothetical protein
MFAIKNAFRRFVGSSQPTPKEDDEEDLDQTTRSSPPLQTSAIEGDSRRSVGANDVGEAETPKEKKKRKGKRKSSATEQIPRSNDLEQEDVQTEPPSGNNGVGDSLEGHGAEEEEQDAPIERKKTKRRRTSKKKEFEKQPDELILDKLKKKRKSRAKSVVDAHPMVDPELDNPDGAGISEPNTNLQEEVGDHSRAARPVISERIAPQQVEVVLAARSPEDMDGVGNEEHASAGASKRKRKKTFKPWLSEARVIDSSQEHGPKNEHNDTPIRHSAKALGKRKASDMRPETVSKPKRARKSKESPGMTLLDLGFSKESSGSQMATEDLVQTAKDLYLETTMELPEPSPILPPGSKSKTKSKAKAQMMMSGSASTVTPSHVGRRPTPKFTPINRQLAKEPSPQPQVNPVTVSENGLDDTADLSIQAPSSPPKSNKKRKRRNLVNIEEREGEPSQPAAAVNKLASGEKASRPSITAKEPSKESEPIRPGAAVSTPASEREASLSSKKPKKTSKESESTEPSAAVSLPASERKVSQPSKKQKELSKDGPPRKGKLTSRELDAIDTAVQTYRDMHDLTQFRVNELIQGSNASAETKELWKSIRDAVPDVPHRKLYDTCRRRFHNFESRGSWTKEQDEELKDAYAQYPQKWKQIGELISRFPEDARDRWRNYLVCGDNQRKDYWDKEEEDRLREVVADCVEILRKDRRKAKESSMSRDTLEAFVDWQVVSQKMDGSRSRLQCHTKWKQMKEREDSNDEEVTQITKTEWRAEEATRQAQAMAGDEILQLLVAIRDSGAGKESKIPWLLITEAIQKLGKRMALRICFRKLRKKVPGNKNMHFKEILDTLITEFEDTHPYIPERYVDNEYIRPIKRKSTSQIPSTPRRASGAPAEGSRKIQRRTTWGTQDRRANGSSVSSSKKSKKLDSESSEEGPEESQEDSDHGQRRCRKKTKSKPTHEPFVDEESIEQDGSTARLSSSKSRRKSNPQPVITSDEDDEQPHTPKPKKRKKLRESMKMQDESRSQDAVVESGKDQDDEDITEIFESLKKKVPQMRKGKAKNMEHILGEELADRGNPDLGSLGHDNQDDNQWASQFSEEHQPPENKTSGGVTDVDDLDTAEASNDDDEPQGNGQHHGVESELDDDNDGIVNDANLEAEDVSHPPSPTRSTASEDSDDNADGQLDNSQRIGFNNHASSPDLAAKVTVNSTPSQQSEDEEELVGDRQTQVANDEMDLDPENKVSPAAHNAPSSESSSDEEDDQTPDRAESVDLDTLKPATNKHESFNGWRSFCTDTRDLPKAPNQIAHSKSRVTSSSSSSDSGEDPDSDSSSDELPEQGQSFEEQAQTLDHEIGQFGEEEEVDEDHDMAFKEGEIPESDEEMRVPPPPKAKIQQHCKYYSAGGKCAKKDKCRFVHDVKVRAQALQHKEHPDAIPDPGQSVGNPPPSKAKTQQLCKYYSTGNICENQSNCRFVHDVEVRTQAYKAYTDAIRRTQSSENGKTSSKESGDNGAPLHSPRARQSISPDLDTPVKNDGRRSFRARAKQINYDDTAHLNANANDSDFSSTPPPPKVKRQTKKVMEPIVSNTERCGSVSSSDYSIPAEATPKQIRAERMYDESMSEEPEKVGWEASDLPKPKKKNRKSVRA